MHSVQPVKKQESAAKRRKDTHTAEKKNVYFPEYADKRHASERGEIRA
jgi:glucosyltransferase